MSNPTLLPSVCPHDCTSTCALEIEVLDKGRIGKVRGSGRNAYTAGVICEKSPAMQSVSIIPIDCNIP